MHLQSYSTDSIYLLQRSVRDEGDERLPLRDAVEKRPISLIEPESAFKLIEVKKCSHSLPKRDNIKTNFTNGTFPQDAEVISDEESVSGLKYYGAAGHLNV